MSEIDPQAVFISEAGEVRVVPQHAGAVTIHELQWRPLRFEELTNAEVPTTLYDTIHVLPERARTAICHLLEEQKEQDELLDRCASALFSLALYGMPRVTDQRLDALLFELQNREMRRRQP